MAISAHDGVAEVKIHQGIIDVSIHKVDKGSGLAEPLCKGQILSAWAVALLYLVQKILLVPEIIEVFGIFHLSVDAHKSWLEIWNEVIEEALSDLHHHQI